MTNKITCPSCLTENFSNFDIKTNDSRKFKGKCVKCKKNIKFQLNNGLLDRDSISFSINGVDYTVDNNYPLTMTLNEYLRDILNITGTKVMCREGGCGSCTATVEVFDYTTGTTDFKSVNTCLLPLLSCDGLKITTIEGVGGKSNGFNEIQKRLANNNGTQCGFCTPGFVMNMYGLLLNDPKPTKAKIESSFDGNICRCTGYRSILDTMKSFAVNENPIDLEELHKLKCVNKSNGKCSSTKKNVHIIKEDAEWFAPTTMDALFDLLTEYQKSNYRIISSNTGVGIYKNEGPYDAYIMIKNIPDLYQLSNNDTSLTIGSEMSLNKLIEIFDTFSSFDGFQYLSVISSHIGKIANVSVRNVATWAGNLILKQNHLDFPSDVFICLETINASIKLVGPDKSTPSLNVSPLDLMTTPIAGKIIYSLSLSAFDNDNTIIKTFKIMPRSQNSHAYVNAGFNFTLYPNQPVIKTCKIVFGGLSKNFVHATQTENFLVNRPINDEKTLFEAFQVLSTELIADDDPVLSSPEYRKSLALSLFYKFLLYANKNNLSPRFQSAFDSLIDTRDISSGTQSFPTNPAEYPVSKPMPKLNALLQTSGEASYIYDKTISKNELHGAFILSEIANCRLDQIDISDAINMPGVVKIIFAKDIPGKNSFVPSPAFQEKVFADDYIDYAGQSVGLVVAQTYQEAAAAARAVKITYKEIKPPILNVFDAIKAKSFFDQPTKDFIYGDAEGAIKNSPNVIQNDFFLDTQYHFHMENHVAISEPYENNYNIHCATQFIDFVQSGVAQVLNLPNNSMVNVKTEQLGGAYGGKITRSNLPACAAAVASYVLNRTVRVSLDLNTSLEMIGKRFPWYTQYTVGFDNNGVVSGLVINWFCDSGNSPTDNSMPVGPLFVDNVYSIKNWHIISNLAKTNLPANTAVRSPGFFPSIAIIENIIETVAKYLKADPLKIRQLNMYKKGDVTPTGQPLTYFYADVLVNDLVQSSDYANRLNQIQQFNQNNRWKKKGLSITPIKWGIGWAGGYYNCQIAIYASDGSVKLSHGGIECGQGIHTKAVQVLAYSLNIPMEIVSVKHADDFTNPNAQATGGSITSELVAKAVIECCKLVNAKLDPIRKQMPPNYTWKDLITKAFSMGVDLSTRYWVYPTNDTPFAYCIYGAACSEAEVDVLTGETQINRIDILYDGGQSLNPEIDIGQAEGAFVMGMGFWLTEKVRYDPTTGKNLTNGTWEYKVPTTKDIPIDFRITFTNKNPNPVGVLGSKAIGEPPLCLTPSVFFSVRNAIEAARLEIGKTGYFNLNSPITVESVQQACLVDISQFKFRE